MELSNQLWETIWITINVLAAPSEHVHQVGIQGTKSLPMQTSFHRMTEHHLYGEYSSSESDFVRLHN